MRCVFILAWANLRKHKGAGLSLGLMVLIAAALLNLGLLSLTGLPHIFDSKLTDLNAPYVSAVISDGAGKAQQQGIVQYLKQYKGVSQTQAERVLFFPTATFTLKGNGSYSNAVLIENTDTAGRLGKLTFVGEKGPISESSIYVPYILHAKGYRLGESFTLTSAGKDYHFTIAGFTEDLMFGSLQTGGVRFFMPDTPYQKLSSELKGMGAELYSARTNSEENATELYDAVNERVTLQGGSVTQTGLFSIDIAKLASSMPIQIGASMEIAFALVVALVVLLVIRFRIANSIEEDMQNIGALEAVGYTSHQIRLGFILQFLLITLTGSLAGIGASYAVAVPHGKLLASETGLNWVQAFDPGVSCLTLFILLLCVAAVAFFATRRIRRLPVIIALRGGISTHSFRRNFLPLEFTRGPVNLLLSVKASLSNARQNVALVLILAAVSFASIFVFLLFYNFAVDNTAVMHVMAGEPDDIVIAAKSPEDAAKLSRVLPGKFGISQVTDYGYATFKAGGKSGYGRITSDFSKMKNDQTYEGRFPKHDNEVAIGGKLAQQLHKRLGDNVSVSVGDKSGDFIITGLTQSVSDIGRGIYLTTAGIKRIYPDYESTILFVYLNSGTDINSAIHSINTQYSSQISVLSNDRDTMQAAMGSYSQVVAGFAGVVFAVMGLIVILILTLITGAMLVRRRREFGIERALGFTTWQLMRQISLGALPAAIIGSLLGGILGWFGSSGLISLLFKGMGIMKIEFILPPAAVPVVCIIVALLTYSFSMLSAVKVRKISPCALISE